jgi:phosphohistidine phosphatase SixA
VAVILLRHASAGKRKAWRGDDRVRPLDERGLEQAQALRDLLLSHGVRQAPSSPFVRCTQTVAPLGLDIELDERLAEGVSHAATIALLTELENAVAFTHGDVVEDVIGRSLDKGAAAVLAGLLVVGFIAAP